MIRVFPGTEMENGGKGEAILFISHLAVPEPEENKALGNKKTYLLSI